MNESRSHKDDESLINKDLLKFRRFKFNQIFV